MTIKAKKSKINLREKLAELLNFRQIRDRLDGLGLYLGKDRTGTSENLAVRGGANVDDLQLAEISAALGDTAVDVFVYDTRKDSDGGAWRGRTSHTSWYNEELNTSTRGGRREFPAVAVIVAESNKVTIYDGDDPDLPMWMVFNATSSFNLITQSTVSSLSALNGVVCVGVNGSSPHLTPIDFISEKSGHYTTAGNKYFLFGISKRNNTNSPAHGSYDSTVAIVNSVVNDVAMTVLPGAPIDDDTGLPIPTIAVATDGGVSVIKDDGSVVDIGYTAQTIESLWLKQNRIWITAGNGALIVGDIPDTDKSSNAASTLSSLINGWNAFANTNEILSTLGSTDTLTHGEVFGSDQGLNLIYEEKSNPASSLVAYTTSSYNTGWMPGDIKLATLSDTKVEKVGVDESTELINLNDGYATTGSWTIDSNTRVATTTSTDALNYYRTGLTTQSGKKYTATLTITNYTGSGDLGVASLTSGAISSNLRLSANGTVTIQFNGSNEEISLFYRSTNTATMELSIKQTGELITNGTFDNGTEGWETTSVTNSLISVTNEQLTVNRNGNGFYASGTHQAIDTVVGGKYTASVDVVSATHYSNLEIVTNVSTGANRQNTNIAGDSFEESGKTGTLVATFTATTSVTYIILTTANNSHAESVFDNVSVRLAEDDRSVNDNGLQIFGEIDKTPVAPGADLVAYSGFSADNYLMQPYNSDLDFGTGDFSIMFWYYNNGSSRTLRIQKHTGVADGWALSLGDNVGDFYIRNGDWTVFTNFNGLSEIGVWEHFSIIRKYGDQWYVYKNGKLAGTTIILASNDFNDNGILKLDSGDVSTNLVTLLRISSTAPTAEQIAKIYRDEKALFTDGAQATLYGTDDAVTALAYDDKTELLHVGTSDGRSDFAGLRRINNTTTAVTTSISASNNLIAEQ